MPWALRLTEPSLFDASSQDLCSYFSPAFQIRQQPTARVSNCQFVLHVEAIRSGCKLNFLVDAHPSPCHQHCGSAVTFFSQTVGENVWEDLGSCPVHASCKWIMYYHSLNMCSGATLVWGSHAELRFEMQVHWVIKILYTVRWRFLKLFPCSIIRPDFISLHIKRKVKYLFIMFSHNMYHLKLSKHFPQHPLLQLIVEHSAFKDTDTAQIKKMVKLKWICLAVPPVQTTPHFENHWFLRNQRTYTDKINE